MLKVFSLRGPHRGPRAPGPQIWDPFPNGPPRRPGGVVADQGLGAVADPPGAARQPYGASSALICANSANSRKVAPGTLHKRAFRALTYQWMLGAYAHTYGASLPSLWDGGGARDSSPTAPRAPASRPRIRGEFVRTVRGKGHAKRHVEGHDEGGNGSS